MWLGAASAQADVIQVGYFKLKEGKTLADWVAVANDWKAAADKAGIDYRMELVSSVAGGPPNVYAVLGRSTTMKSYGEAWDWWLANGAELQRRFSEVSEPVAPDVVGTTTRIR
jgi:hypothetical protein